jgi:hypothetical protein
VGGDGGPAALRTAVDRGEIPASVDPSTRAKGLVATSQSLMVVGKANPDEEVLPAIVDNAFADRLYFYTSAPTSGTHYSAAKRCASSPPPSDLGDTHPNTLASRNYLGAAIPGP